ncbi:unnamed protein product, partial [Phaeothamnion confervicola]
MNVDRLKNNVEHRIKKTLSSKDEERVFRALSNKNKSSSPLLLAEIAEDTYHFDRYNTVMRLLFKAIESPPRSWRSIFKGLALLEYLITCGAERVVDEARDHVHILTMLRDFSYFDKMLDRGAGVREKAGAVCELLGDNGRIKEERQRARDMRAKFAGISVIGSGMSSGSSREWGQDSGGGSSGYSGSYGDGYDDHGGGDGGGEGGEGGWNDDDDGASPRAAQDGRGGGRGGGSGGVGSGGRGDSVAIDFGLGRYEQERQQQKPRRQEERDRTAGIPPAGRDQLSASPSLRHPPLPPPPSAVVVDLLGSPLDSAVPTVPGLGGTQTPTMMHSFDPFDPFGGGQQQPSPRLI